MLKRKISKIQKVGPDVRMEMEERFNPDKLNYIIENEAKYRALMRPKCFQSDHKPFTIAKKYLLNSKDGKIKIQYKQNESKGRFFAKGGQSLQSLPREVRHTIGQEFYIDIDMKNAHPVILEHLCKLRGLSCVHLSYYNQNRDKCLTEIDVNKETAKTAILSMVNGGTSAKKNLENPPLWLDAFEMELRLIHSAFATDAEYPAHKARNLEKGKDFNHEAGYMNCILVDFENKILQVVYVYIKSPKNCVLCFDGLMLEKGYLESLEITIDTIEKEVYAKLNIHIQMAFKPMLEGFKDEGIMNCRPYKDMIRNRFDFSSPFDYQDLHNYCIHKNFDSLDDFSVYFKSQPLVIAKILAGSGQFVKKCSTEQKMEITKKLETSDIIIKYEETKEMYLSAFLRKEEAFGTIVCDMENASTKNFNCFSGFQATLPNKPESPETRAGVEKMKHFIYESWANRNEEHYRYILAWFAGLVTNLTGTNRVCLVMVSSEGAGKGTLVEFMGYILRDSNIISPIGVDSITGTFNQLMEGKRLVVLNEQGSTKENFRGNADKMKSIIADPTLMIRPLYGNHYQVKNISNVLCCTNHRDCMVIGQTDRHYAVFEMPNIKRDADFWIDLRKDCFNQEVANLFYADLLELDHVSLHKIPETAIRSEMMQLSKNSVLKFLDVLYSLPCVLLETTHEPIRKSSDNIPCTIWYDDDVHLALRSKMLAASLYKEYSDWCKENHENTFSNCKFGTIVGQHFENKHTKKGRMYDLTKIKLPSEFQQKIIE